MDTTYGKGQGILFDRELVIMDYYKELSEAGNMDDVLRKYDRMGDTDLNKTPIVRVIKRITFPVVPLKSQDTDSAL